MIVLIAFQTIRNEYSQKRLQSQLDAIQNNTEHPNPPIVNLPAPVVNVNFPKPNPKAATILRTKVWSGYTIGPPLPLGKPILINSTFNKEPGPTAEHFRGAGRVYVLPNVNQKTEQDAIRDFKKDLEPALRRTAGSPIGHESPEGIWFSSAGKTLTQDDPNDCTRVQNPPFNPEIWQNCEGFHENK